MDTPQNITEEVARRIARAHNAHQPKCIGMWLEFDDDGRNARVIDPDSMTEAESRDWEERESLRLLVHIETLKWRQARDIIDLSRGL